jgi:glycosyltransferase involved in cell wall biosynthesis
VEVKLLAPRADVESTRPGRWGKIEVTALAAPPEGSDAAAWLAWARDEAVAEAVRLRKQWPFQIVASETFWPDAPLAHAVAQACGIPFTIKGRGYDVVAAHEQETRAAAVRAAAEAAALLLCVGEALARRLVQLGYPADKIAVHHTGLDRTAFRLREAGPLKSKLSPDGPLLLSVGNLYPLKGHHIVIDALTRIPEATLCIAGGGPQAERLETQIERLGLAGRARLLGFVPHLMLPSLMAAADVTVLASAQEGLANVWIESLACGTPVVTTDVAGGADVIRTPELGRIVPRDASAIARAVAELLAARPPRDRVAAAVAGFSWERNASELEAHLRGALAGR